MYGGSLICSALTSSMLVGTQIYRYQAKLTPLLCKNIKLSFLFGFGCGVADYSGYFLTKHMIQMTDKEKFKDIEKRLNEEEHYQNLKKLPCFVGCALGPIGEELLFRGAIQPLLVASIGVYPGIFASSLIFGLAHTLKTEPPDCTGDIKVSINNDASAHMQACNACISGFFIGYVRHQFGLISAIGVHAGFNSTVFSKRELLGD